MTDLPSIWALKIQPNDAADDTSPYEFCKNRSPPIIGTGWGLDDHYESKEDALDAHRDNDNTDTHGNVRYSIRAMIRKASVGDYVWVNEGSEYALCRIESDWKQHPVTSTNDAWTRHDIHNYREALWRVIEPALVPGYIKRYFSAPRTLPMAQPDGGKTESAKRYAEELFTEAPEQGTEIVAPDEVSNIVSDSSVSEVFDLLDPVETEDLVLDYLQSQGWHIVKSSTSRSQPGIECVLRRISRTPKIAYVQVKSGHASVDINDYLPLTENAIVYIHQFDEPDTEVPDRLRWVSPIQLKEYIVSQPGYLPPHTAFKLKLGLDTS
nr:hypothetical protein 9 [bacterium]